jgi:gliding motility-associated-like protein
VYDRKNCEQTGTLSVGNVGAPDIFVQAQSDSLCQGESSGFIRVALSAQTNPPYTYLWSHSASETDALAEGLSAGTYTVTVVNGSGCQSISQPITIGAYSTGSIQLGNDTAIVLGQTIRVSVVNSTNVSSVSWGPDRFLAETGFSAYVFPTQTTTYWVEGESDNGCIATDSIVIFVDTLEYAIRVPNVFSPNADGTNDRFFVTAENVETFEMHVYDRWGNKVYESYDLDDRWNGTDFGGKPCPAGVYAYVIYVRTYGSVEKEPVISGNITLIK